MPSFGDWLKASWSDFRGRWGVLFAVGGLTGAATLVAAFAPFALAGLASLAGAGPAWALWAAAATTAVLGALWLSTWGQAALTRAALTEEPAGDCLARAWGQTSAFAWVLTLTLLAAAGGFFLLVLPGLVLSVLLFFAPFFMVSGEADGTRALALSWARVGPRFGTVAVRVTAAALIAAAPGWIPYLGWIFSIFWAPFGIVALARLARDLRAADPEPALPSWMGAAVAALSVVFVLGSVGGALAFARAFPTIESLQALLAAGIRP